MAVPFFDLKRQIAAIKPDIEKTVSETIDGAAFILGPKVVELEKFAASYLGAKHAIGVASGTDALLLSIKAAGIGEGDEVITTPFTFVATAEAVAYHGARPVFVDITTNTFNIDVSKIERAITKNTKAILPVHLYGRPADMDDIMSIAKKHRLKVVEDCAQAIGSKYKGKYTGSIGDAGCFSFFPTKNLGCFGDGGLVTTDSDDLAEMLRVLRGHGSRATYHYDVIGYNSRLDSIQAAILLVRFKHLKAWEEKRRKHADQYRRLLSGIDEVVLPADPTGDRHVYNQFVIIAKDRDRLFEHLKSRQIGCMVYYPLSLHLQAAFKGLGYKKGDMPVSEAAQDSVLALPIFPELEEKEIAEVCSAILEFYGKG